MVLVVASILFSDVMYCTSSTFPDSHAKCKIVLKILLFLNPMKTYYMKEIP